MAAAVAITPASMQVGDAMVVACTGFAATHAITVQIPQLGVNIKGTTDGSGNFTSTALADIVPQSDSPLDVIVSDGTSKITQHVLITTE